MPLTVTNITGDGVNDDLLDTSIQLPDSGTAVNITGRVVAVGQPSVVVTGSPLTMPAPPASGSTFWNIQVDVTSGAATVQQSSSGDPAPVGGNSRVVFRQTLSPSSTDPATTPDSTPDTW